VQNGSLPRWKLGSLITTPPLSPVLSSFATTGFTLLTHVTNTEKKICWHVDYCTEPKRRLMSKKLKMSMKNPKQCYNPWRQKGYISTLWWERFVEKYILSQVWKVTSERWWGEWRWWTDIQKEINKKITDKSGMTK